MTKQEIVPSPQATGGAGTTFEQHVGAMFLALLLTRGIPAVFRNCQVEEVSFQTRHLGWQTDDLLITCSTDKQEKRKLAIQAKRSFTVGTSSADCKETFEGFWKDFKSREIFDPDKDALVLATLHGSISLMNGLGGLLECARNSANADDFAHRQTTPGLLSTKAKNCLEVIKGVISGIESSDIDDEDLWRFLKVIRLLALDLTTSSAQHEAVVKQLLAQSSSGSDAVKVAETTWFELLQISGASAAGARILRRADLPDGIRAAHKAVQAPWNVLEVLIGHSDITLGPIRSTINGTVTLPRTQPITQAIEVLSEYQVVVLTGPPGYGKSALAKVVVGQQASNHVCLSFRAEEFAESHIDRVLQGKISGKQFSILMGAQEKVLIHVESLERLLEHPTRDAFADLVGIAEQFANVRLLLTCRDYSIATALAAFFDQSQLTRCVLDVPALNEEELNQVKNALPGLSIPMANPGLKQLLRVPYFLEMAAGMDWSGQEETPFDIKTFRERCWGTVVRRDSLTSVGLPDRRGKALVDLSVRRARALRSFVPTDGIDVEALDALHKDGVVLKDGSGLAAPAHDVIEDWAIIGWIESLAVRHEWQAHPMADDIGPHPAIRRGFREWLKEALYRETEKADQFVLTIYGDNSLPQHFRDDVLVSVLLSHSASDFIARQKEQLLGDGAQLLVRLIHLTRVACKKTPTWLQGMIAPPSVLLEPEGEAWPALLEILADGIDHLLATHTGPILGLMEDWAQGASTDSPTPSGTASVGQIAYRLLDEFGGYWHEDSRNRVLKVIARVPRSNESRFIDLVNRASARLEHDDSLLEELSKFLIGRIDGIPACRDFPEQIARLTLSWCRLTEQDLERAQANDDGFLHYGGIPDIEPDFGIRFDHDLSFFPQSAIQGPFLPLLKFHPLVGMKLILELLNHAGDWYGNRKWPENRLESAHLIKISVPSDGDIEQWANDRLWQAYRGTSVVPNVIQCALMALESWLLDLCEFGHDVEPWLLKIIAESNNVMATSVVASVCNAYPAPCGKVALALLKSRPTVQMDRMRMVKEGEADALLAFPVLDPTKQVHEDERRRSNALQHRPHDLEALAWKLQLGGMPEQVEQTIDFHRSQVPNEAERTDEDRVWLLALHRMDVRQWRAENTEDFPGGAAAEDEPTEDGDAPSNDKGLDVDLQNFVSAGVEANQRLANALSLWNWGLKRWQRNYQNEDADSWLTALTLARNCQVVGITESPGRLLESGPGLVAAVCVRDHWNSMSCDDRQWCLQVLVDEVKRDSDSDDFMVQVSNDPTGADRLAAYVLPKVLAHAPENTVVIETLASAITHASSQVALWASEGVAEYLEPEHRSLVLNCVGATAMHANLSTLHEPPRISRLIPRVSDQGSEAQNPLDQVREAFVQGSINAEQELSKLDLTSPRGEDASKRILAMLSKSPDLGITTDILIRVGLVIIDSWVTRRQSRRGQRYSATDNDTLNSLTRILLTLPPPEALLCCQAFLDAVDDHPKEVARLIETLVLQEDQVLPNRTCFWDVWQAFADRIIEAPWSEKIGSSHLLGEELMDKMLFRTYWKEGVRRWSHLDGQEQRVNEFTTRLPAVSRVLLSYAYFLYKIGEGSLPNAFEVVADRLQVGDSAELLSDGNTVFYLESLLQRYVYGQPVRLKSNPAVRHATITILNNLVDAGSASAYKMRDDFVTPSVGQSHS